MHVGISTSLGMMKKELFYATNIFQYNLINILQKLELYSVNFKSKFG